MPKLTWEDGFRNTRYWRFDAVDRNVRSLELLLPTTFPENFGEKTLETAFLQEKLAATAAAGQAVKVDPIQSSSESDDSRVIASFKTVGTNRTKPGVLTPEAARSILESTSTKVAAQTPKGRVTIYEWDAPVGLISLTRTPDKELVERNKKIFDAISKIGNTRPVVSIPRKKIIATCQRLESRHPNFASVIATVRKEMLLSIARKRPLRITPMLLIGPPGVGKTHFVKALAGALRTSVVSLSFDSGLTSGALLGTDRHWANTSTGKVFDAVVMGMQANPILMLDEIDKAGVNSHGQQHPLESLHSLLEPVTSRSVTDISAEFTFDASHVIWIATANYPDRIAGTVRSRFSEHMITEPTAEQALELARIMLLAVHKEMAIPKFHPPTLSLAKHIAHLNAREMRQAIEGAFANAVETGRFELCSADFHSTEDSPQRDSGGPLMLH